MYEADTESHQHRYKAIDIESIHESVVPNITISWTRKWYSMALHACLQMNTFTGTGVLTRVLGVVYIMIPTLFIMFVFPVGLCMQCKQLKRHS